jgi:thiamine phosphate synthase YjbQ (UPF0047 family)
MNHLDDLLVGLDVTLTDDLLDRIDELVPSGAAASHRCQKHSSGHRHIRSSATSGPCLKIALEERTGCGR